VPGAQAEGGSGLLPLLLLGILLVLLVAAIFYVWNRRRTLMSSAPVDVDEDGEVYGEEGEPVAGPTAAAAGRAATGRKSMRPARPSLGAGTAATAAAAAAAEPAAIPIARFRTSYTRGHDNYDDSFSIENANGDFLGECGVGISDTVGGSIPKNVTAFEVWLFDKNDIRTITKVIMSDHAFFDEALKAKLAPKGEPVLARRGETIVLETATLIINAEITELDYGPAADQADASYFERFTIELSAWAKEGDFVAPVVEDEEDPLNY
jgi:hypothetical protein